jgi:hypothetical protein
MVPIALSRHWLSTIAVVAAGAGVFWAFDALPFQDLPAHAGLIALRHRLAAGSSFEGAFYTLSPRFGPHSAFRWTGDLLATVLGPVRAVRALMTLAVVALPASLGGARHRLHGDGAASAALLGTCLSFGFLTMLGFASYLLGVAALVVAFALLVVGLGEAEGASGLQLRTEALLAGASALVLLTHGFAFLVLLGLATSATLAATTLRRMRYLRALVPSLALAGRMAWQEGAQSPTAEGIQGMPPGAHFAGAIDKLGLLFSPTLTTRWGVDLLVGCLLWGLLVACLVATARAHGGWRESPPRLRGALGALAALCAAFVCCPRSVGWFGFVDGRLVPLSWIVAVLAVERAAMPRWARTVWDEGVPVGAAVIVLVLWIGSYRFQSEASGWQRVLQRVPERSTLLNLPLDPDSEALTGHPFVHYDKLALADRPLVVSDVWFQQGTALGPTPDNPALRLPAEYSESNLQRIEWSSYRLRDWDYVLLRTKPRAPFPSPGVPAGLSLVAHEGGWWLLARSGDGSAAR